MDERLLAIAIPVFFALLAAEVVFSWRRRRRLYRLHDTISNLGCGVGMVATSLWFNLVVALAYGWVFERFALLRLPAGSAWTWLGGLLLIDLCHYWFHRASHRINFFWAAHAVHHQSDEYNLSAALRQSWLEPLWSLPFYLPLALLGLPLPVFLAMHAIHTIYQFWIHTRVIDRLGPLELFLNTPSHHRVHHAIEPEYIDRNYAGILILWDRLFGTFEPERRTPHYGTVTPFKSWNPLRANAHEWARIFTYAAASRRVTARLGSLFAPPEWRPERLGGTVTIPEVDAGRKVPWDTSLGLRRDLYVLLQFLVVTAGATALLLLAPSLAWWRVGLGIGWVIGTLGVIGGLMDRAAWSRRAEEGRVLATIPIATALAGIPGGVLATLLAALSRKWLGKER
jgi:alkylglycerol monooxygenase